MKTEVGFLLCGMGASRLEKMDYPAEGVMGEFVRFEDIVTDASGDGSMDVAAKGVLALIDIVPADSSSFDITISRVLPDSTLVEIYAATGVTATTTLQRSDMNQSSLELAGTVRVVLANAGEHADAAHVYLTVL